MSYRYSIGTQWHGVIEEQGTIDPEKVSNVQNRDQEGICWAGLELTKCHHKLPTTFSNSLRWLKFMQPAHACPTMS